MPGTVSASSCCDSAVRDQAQQGKPAWEHGARMAMRGDDGLVGPVDKQGCRELETSLAAVSLGQGLAVPGAEISHGQVGRSPGEAEDRAIRAS